MGSYIVIDNQTGDIVERFAYSVDLRDAYHLNPGDVAEITDGFILEVGQFSFEYDSSHCEHGTFIGGSYDCACWACEMGE